MTKEKLYNPDKCGTFEMQFGFDQPKPYNHARDLRNKIKRYEDQRHCKKAVNTETSSKR
tara:strand:+ start:730 stop:906 length:177 start_codon:yes stop_codon:yes gene_type:complete